jgi:hypothetical protein
MAQLVDELHQAQDPREVQEDHLTEEEAVHDVIEKKKKKSDIRPLISWCCC